MYSYEIVFCNIVKTILGRASQIGSKNLRKARNLVQTIKDGKIVGSDVSSIATSISRGSRYS